MGDEVTRKVTHLLIGYTLSYVQIFSKLELTKRKHLKFNLIRP